MKYIITTEMCEYAGHILYRIEAAQDFSNVKKGEKGGWIERVENLSQCGSAWVYGDAVVYGDAWVYDSAKVCGDAEVSGNADYIVFKNWWSSGRYYTWTRSNNKWRVGCFYGTGEELIAKAYKDSEVSGREYQRVIDYVKSILQVCKPD